MELSSLVGSPSWHLVMVRASGLGLTSVLQLWLLETPGRFSLGHWGPGGPLQQASMVDGVGGDSLSTVREMWSGGENPSITPCVN